MRTFTILVTTGLLWGVVSSAVAQTAPTAPVIQFSPRVDAQRPAIAAGQGQYVYTRYKVIGQDNPQGCSSGNWECMTNLCKAELGVGTGRSDAGCWSQGNQWQCTFACEAYRPVQ